MFDERGRVLLVRRGRPQQQGRWTLPGGKVEEDESARDAIMREVREETRLRVVEATFLERVELRGEGFAYDIDEYLCEVAEGEPVAGDDAEDARFFDRVELATVGVTAAVLSVVARARTRRRPESP